MLNEGMKYKWKHTPDGRPSAVAKVSDHKLEVLYTGPMSYDVLVDGAYRTNTFSLKSGMKYAEGLIHDN